jgi:hypothetical protein
VTVLSVAVAVGKELASVTDPGMASVVLSTPVEVAEASVTVAEEIVPDASEAEALERRLEKSEANDEVMALSVAMATTLESCEFREEAMLDKAPVKSPVVVSPSDEAWVAPVDSAEAKEEMSVSRAAWAEETILDNTSGVPVAVALTGSGMMSVVELSAKAVLVDSLSVESPVVVAKRGKGSVEAVEAVEAVEITVALLASG